MKFFEAQKRASFATKLFATIGFDFDAALTASNENALKAVLAAHTSPAIEALFTTAGLKSADLVAAGPEALKLHIEGLDDSAAAAQLTTDLAVANARAKKLDGEVFELSEIVQHITTAIALPVAKDAKATDIKSAFDQHVSKQTTLALAKTGHPPAHVPAAVPPVATAPTDAELYAEYSKMETGALRLDFYTKHEAALVRASKAAKSE